MSNPPPPPTASTVSILSYLATVYAWMLEVLVLLIHFFGKGNLDPLGHGTLVAVACTLTVIARVRGKREFERLRWTRGRILLTGRQTVVITATLMGFVAVMTFVLVRLVGR